MQKCYNCGKEVDDNVLICPDCGALVKRYGRPESAQPEQEADPFPRETAFDTQPQPRGAVWQQEDGKLKFSGYVTFWLALCAIYPVSYTHLDVYKRQGVQDQGNIADGVLDALDEMLSLIRAHGAGHVLQADGVEAQDVYKRQP